MRYKIVVGSLAVGFIIGILCFKGNCMHAGAKDNLIPRKVLFGNPERAMFTISPDGTKLAYLAPQNGVLNVWVKTVGQSDDHVVTSDTNRGIRNYQWGFDSSSILYIQDKNGDENWNLYRQDLVTGQATNLTPFEDVHVNIIKYCKEVPTKMLIGLNKDDKRFHDVYQLDLLSGTLEQVAKNTGDVIDWHADQQLQVRGMTRRLADGSSIVLIRKTVQEPWQELISWSFDDALTSGVVGFARDGNKIYLEDSADANTARLISIDSQTKHKKVIAADDMYDVTSVMLHPDTQEPLAVTFTKERDEIMLVDQAYEADFAALKALDHGDIKILGYDNSFGTWVVAFIKDNGPTSYYVYRRSTKQGQFLCTNRPALERYTLASMNPIALTARDGLKLHGYLTMPITYAQGSKVPLVLMVHGGPWARDQWGFNPYAQWFANRGLACLQINYRGSTGYGKAFINAGNKEWARKMHDDLLDAVNWAIAGGAIDPQKIGIFGGSYGGYAALVGATLTPDVFCCAVDIVGPSNLITLIQSFPPYWTAEIGRMKKMIGDPAFESDMLRERSPLSHVHNIKKPLLIAQGAHDPRVKMAESEQIVAAMKEKNIPHEYMVFHDEGHGFAKPENSLKFCAAAEKFLSKHMGGRYEE